MALYHQPRTHFCTLPPDIILAIAQELGIIDPIGPPRHLPAFFRLCKHVTNILTSGRKAVFAAIYRAKFDTAAPSRRLHPALTASAFAFQLKKQTLALKRIRNADVRSDNLLSDLWTAYLMLLENDGRNYQQLVEYGRIHDLLDAFTQTELWARRERWGNDWPLETTPNALVIWLLWFTMTPDRLLSLIPQHRDAYMKLLLPFVLSPAQYTWAFAPDDHFKFPLEDALRDGRAIPDDVDVTLFPLYRDPTMVTELVLHFGRKIAITSPLVSVGAKMLFTMLSESVPYTASPLHPVNRAVAPPGVVATHDDFREWASIRGVQFYPHAHPHENRPGDDPSRSRDPVPISTHFDNDWMRLTGCLDPYRELPLKRTPYKLGSIIGVFGGRMVVPEHNRYLALTQSRTMPALDLFPKLNDLAVYVSFREHHCINPAPPVPTGGRDPKFDDGVTDGYFPKHTMFLPHGNVLQINVPGASPFTYETYVPGRPSSHNPATCRQCRAHRRADEQQHRARIHDENDRQAEYRASLSNGEVDEAMSTEFQFTPRPRRDSVSSQASQESHMSYVYGDPDDPDAQMRANQMMLDHDRDAEAILDEMMSDDVPEEYEQYVQAECDGVSDIIVTGTTIQRHAEAWHDYRWFGRIRKWDGLIVLVRNPVERDGAAGSTYIFRGYLVGDRNFVGSWRSYAEKFSATVHEGPFALSRIDGFEQIQTA